MHIDLHILQTLPYSNLNRDDTGTPKSVVYGGATRARVSSQAWKRAARRHVEAVLGAARSYRTRHPDQRLAELLEERGKDPGEAEAWAKWAFQELGTGTKGSEGSVILFISEQELAALCDVLLRNDTTVDDAVRQAAADETKKKVDDTKKKGKVKPGTSAISQELKGCLTVPRPTSVALFGRMLAADPEINVDAAVQVAHAFSVNPIEIEVDYFTAAEDLPTRDDLTGGAHIGTSEFVTATLYRFITINTDELVDNIGGDLHAARELAALAIAAFALSVPTGKTNVTAPHTVPDVVNLAVRDARPASYAAAFEQPISRTGGVGVARKAVEKLAGHATRVNRVLAPPVFAGHVQTLADELDNDTTIGLGTSYEHLTQLIEAAVDAAFAEVAP